MLRWDGTTPKRKDLSTARAAVHEDYLVIVQKIQELQEYCLNLTDNMQIMPNLEHILQEAQSKINEVQGMIDAISLPQDVKDQLAALEENLTIVDQRASVMQLCRDMDTLKERVNRNQIEVLQLQSSFATEVKGFQNKVWGKLETLQKEATSQLTALAEKVAHIDSQLDLQNSIEKLNQIKNNR
jgi:hypothetical protein